ncbi:hypothetical protein DEA8626_01993 [Defluviimonas aquaemixtae]|uniref:Sirohydrochlorin ferrochelatase n=1 Tax=Albidovulum aquaemixtae TaxID=1542388 RepID=A0A2R8B746_9RHOB|nr:CbiX/SirB N-terminal domain-containing protein [Defluviimonas aquaemixtae]SPH18455.1 hypothetical protein DEA8626_01993 [Defluviimonas aquaemixtae]
MTRSALIVAHGQPSDPEPAEADLAALAVRVGAQLPGWQVASATLAHPDSLRKALQLSDKPFVFPFFMADGWFIRERLPSQFASLGATGLRVLRPFGLMPETLALASAIAGQAVADAGWEEESVTLVLAAHGSGRSRFPSEAARSARAAIERARRFAEIRMGFIEEPPYLTEVLHGTGERTICLPLFVARWGHVLTDIPKAQAESDFTGRCLDPIGTHHEVPRLIAKALRSEA